MLALVDRVCPEFTVVNIYFLSFRIFEQLALALKNRVALKFFTVLKYFIIQDFWAICACPENRAFPEFTVVNIYFLSFRIFEQLALALKTELALKFFKTGERPLRPPHTRLVRPWLKILGGSEKRPKAKAKTHRSIKKERCIGQVV